MNAARICYRTRQFWLNLGAAPSSHDLDEVRAVLNPEQYQLFARLQPGEQAHSLLVMRRLTAQGQTHPDLLAAALLHDIGKIRLPLRLWERVLVVLGKALFPARVKQWGSLAGDEWKILSGARLPIGRRAFIIAEQHAVWGSQMAAGAGSSTLVVELIRRHQDRIPDHSHSYEDNLLRLLQSVDDES
ncbi:MAG: hypothetical protein ACM3PY_12385 [Omnitrophica WOR_2 bacterium]